MNDQLKWFKSSYSDDEGGECVEAAIPAPRTTIHIRDSKNPSGPQLTVTAASWAAFVSAAHPGA
ncbi:DUF397 domain-containing protein [Streptomyces sp. NRRL F-525]|uniref:DUF397 domain-containing protein n=1 Tax=Streptomyces sp. NRRL F-525 TaxID=1463861 RepID=UPI0009978995|nr:DUF397 domain-containing protein [Streptomyces sp. NRRL F-525]